MQQKVFFVGLTLLVTVFSLSLTFYNQYVSAGIPSIDHNVRAGAGGAEAYPYPSISGPWTEGESYDGHGTALAAQSASVGDFHGSESEAYNRWDYDNDEISVTIKTFIDFAGIRILYQSRSYPYAAVWAYSNEYVDEATAYSSGWIYMSSTTDDSDYWPDL